MVQSLLKGSCPPVLITAFDSPSLPSVVSAPTELGSWKISSTAHTQPLRVLCTGGRTASQVHSCPLLSKEGFDLLVCHLLRFPQADPFLGHPLSITHPRGKRQVTRVSVETWGGVLRWTDGHNVELPPFPNGRRRDEAVTPMPFA